MALSGKGTEDSPYILRTYNDFKESTEASPESGDILYLKLDNNINCVNYGDQFLWHTIKYDRHTTIIDLDGHYIKNAYIADEECMFQFEVEPTTHYNRIYNGDIVNVFCHNADYIIYTTKECVSVHFYKVRFSINLNTIITGVFRYAIFDTCSFFIFCNGLMFVNTKDTSHTFFYLYNDSIVTSNIEPKIDACMSKCDFMFDINPSEMGRSNSYAFMHSHLLSDANGTALRNCRLQGTFLFKNISPYYNSFNLVSNGSYSGWNTPTKTHFLDSNVFDIVTPADIVTYGEGYKYNGQPHYSNVGHVETPDGIIKTISGIDATSVRNVTKDQLKDAEYLKSIFFPVECIEV